MFGNLYLYLFVYVSPGLRAEAEPPERAQGRSYLSPRRPKKWDHKIK